MLGFQYHHLLSTDLLYHSLLHVVLAKMMSPHAILLSLSVTATWMLVAALPHGNNSILHKRDTCPYQGVRLSSAVPMKRSNKGRSVIFEGPDVTATVNPCNCLPWGKSEVLISHSGPCSAVGFTDNNEVREPNTRDVALIRADDGCLQYFTFSPQAIARAWWFPC